MLVACQWHRGYSNYSLRVHTYATYTFMGGERAEGADDQRTQRRSRVRCARAARNIIACVSHIGGTRARV